MSTTPQKSDGAVNQAYADMISAYIGHCSFEEIIAPLKRAIDSEVARLTKPPVAVPGGARDANADDRAIALRCVKDLNYWWKRPSDFPDAPDPVEMADKLNAATVEDYFKQHRINSDVISQSPTPDSAAYADPTVAMARQTERIKELEADNLRLHQLWTDSTVDLLAGRSNIVQLRKGLLTAKKGLEDAGFFTALSPELEAAIANTAPLPPSNNPDAAANAEEGK